jgi:hypothetical protein
LQRWDEFAVTTKRTDKVLRRIIGKRDLSKS